MCLSRVVRNGYFQNESFYCFERSDGKYPFDKTVINDVDNGRFLKISNSFRKDEWVTGWKYFYSSINSVTSLYQNKNFNFEKVYTSFSQLLTARDNRSYVSGFHCFLTREDARKWKKDKGKSLCRHAKLYKISMKNPLHIGYEGNLLIDGSNEEVLVLVVQQIKVYK